MKMGKVPSEFGEEYIIKTNKRLGGVAERNV